MLISFFLMAPSFINNRNQRQLALLSVSLGFGLPSGVTGQRNYARLSKFRGDYRKGVDLRSRILRMWDNPFALFPLSIQELALHFQKRFGFLKVS